MNAQCGEDQGVPKQERWLRHLTQKDSLTADRALMTFYYVVTTSYFEIVSFFFLVRKKYSCLKPQGGRIDVLLTTPTVK